MWLRRNAAVWTVAFGTVAAELLLIATGRI